MNRSLRLALFIIIGIVIYAYGFTVTQVNLDELDSPARQESLTRIIRALARPDFLEWEQEEVTVERPIYVPCPDGGAPEPTVDTAGPYMLAPACAAPESEIGVEGFNFAPNSTGPLNFIPPSGVSLQLDRIETDGAGHFQTTVELRDRTSDEPQHLRAITRTNVGWPHLSQNGKDTIDKIIETVFMALLATTLGTLLAIPVSFFAARNLMKSVSSPLPSVALMIIGVPIGMWLGAQAAGLLARVPGLFALGPLAYIGGFAVSGALAFGALRLAVPPPDTARPSSRPRMVQWAVAFAAVALVVLALFFLSDFLDALGRMLAPRLGAFGFVGDFVSDIGQIFRLILPPACALIGGGVLWSVTGRLGQWLVERVNPATGKLLNFVLAAVAGAVLFVLIGLGLAWLYQITSVRYVIVWPAVVGALAGLFVAARTPYHASLPIGLTIYGITRTVLNALRSVEALIMVIVFAVWVGIGPFAGVLALGLHTVAALAKLYSEQVESISNGPLEAVLATGANRLQMIVYAVIPQIVPPYISFTMYRWDINVRMSTIIGFAGGGGIGFLLQQNINLLNYRAASAQIIAIAIVVSAMDYLSSALRQRTL
ncbi:MAG: ABC transporter permease subunit [Caldilineaceae bacterium]|nr:ABC transporter permease subunit [Caldilineaceae bacterium]